MSIFGIMNLIVWYNFSGLKFYGNEVIQSETQKSQYFRRYEDFFNMDSKIFIQQNENNPKLDKTCHDLFCVVNIKMTLAEEEITL